jgi:nucleoside permease NupC
MQPADSLQTPPPPQFTLRTLFVVVTILAALLSVYSYVGVLVLAITYLAGAGYGVYQNSRRHWAGLGIFLGSSD